MAIIRFNNRKNSTTDSPRNKLKRILDYITDSSKTSCNYIGGMGVDKENAIERMHTVKKYYCKEGGRDYIHFCVSFKGKRDPDTVYYAASAIAALFTDFQVLYAVHLNTSNTHIHFVINSVSITDGRKFNQSKYDLHHLKATINEIICSYSLDSDDISIDEEYTYCDYDEFDDCFIDNDDYYDDDDYDEQPLIDPVIFFDDEYEPSINVDSNSIPNSQITADESNEMVYPSLLRRY